ncbi:MAG: DUF1638 domain-containing protein [Coriobacteriales bacterium]|jgi:hypothetical protein|nr:DUF1638 domain-containing protein [Coriobacteriales bacterium]
MKTVLLACKTIKAEIDHVLNATGQGATGLKATGQGDLPVVWIESGLHNTTDRLHLAMQEALDRIERAENPDRVLLGFGFCGNAVLDLRTGDYTLVIPRVDDCITLLLGSFAVRKEISAEGGTYFLTPGWMGHESNIYAEYQYALDKYGKRLTDDIYREILAHYENLGIIDTGVYDFEAFVEQTKVVARTLGLRQRPIRGTLRYIERLLAGPWPDVEFVTVPKFAVVDQDMLDLSD